MGKVKVRKLFSFLPGIAWSLLIDAADFFVAPITFVIGAIPLIGEVFSGIVSPAFTLLQGIFAFIIFDEPKMLLGMSEIFIDATSGVPILSSLSQIGDALIPSFTLTYLAIEKGVV